MRYRTRVGWIGGVGFAITGMWSLALKAVGLINLPKDANDAWKSVVSAHAYIPAGLALLCLGALLWAFFWPVKPANDPDERGIGPPAPPPPPEPPALMTGKRGTWNFTNNNFGSANRILDVDGVDINFDGNTVEPQYIHPERLKAKEKKKDE
jgi:hypothetical protein